MATYKNHLELSSVEENGDVNVLYPVNTGEDVSIKRNNSNLPSGVTNLQQLVDKMGPTAFANAEKMVFAGTTLGTANDPATSEINDNAVKNSLTWSSEKITDYIGKSTTGFKRTTEVGEEYVNSYFPATPQVYSVNTSGFSSNTCPNGTKGNFIVEYFPFVDRSNITNAMQNDSRRVNYALQRWTYLNASSFAVYQRVYTNGTWNSFKKTV